MPATAQGAKELDRKVATIKGQVKAAHQEITEALNLADVVRGELAFRINKGEAPAAAEIPALQGALAAKKAAALDAVNAIEVPTVEEFQALAETPNP